MRFRANLNNGPFFAKILGSVEKVSRMCVVRLSPDKISIAAKPDTGDIEMWAHVNASAIFEDYKVESKNGNEISFELDLANLIRAVRSGDKASVMTVRLTKKNEQPFWTFEVEALNMQAFKVTQDVPVAILSKAEMQQQAAEPDFVGLEGQLKAVLPPLKRLHTIVDRLRTVGNTLHMTLTAQGELQLAVQDTCVDITTYFRNLRVIADPAGQGNSPAAGGLAAALRPHQQGGCLGRPGLNSAGAVLDMRKLSKVLHAWNLLPRQCFCTIVDQRAVGFFVFLEDVDLNYYVPSIVEVV
jgi:HUS1 checkpoint protein